MIRSSILGKAYQDMSLPPDYTPLWITLGIIGGIAIVSLCIFLYVRWKAHNCHPIYFAGKVRYARHGASIQAACELAVLTVGIIECWLDIRARELSVHGRVAGLYLDADLTIPLDKKAQVTAPIRIYPKIIK